MWTKEHQDLITLERVMTDISNKHLSPNMFSRCLDCQTWGGCFPYDRQCGNCNSLNIVRYYSEGAIQKFIEGRAGSEPICQPYIDTGNPFKIRDGKIVAKENNADLCGKPRTGLSS